MNPEKINGIGAIFRFITPALIAITGTLILANVADIKQNVEKLEVYFTNHLHEHKELAVTLERRLTRLETLIRR